MEENKKTTEEVQALSPEEQNIEERNSEALNPERQTAEPQQEPVKEARMVPEEEETAADETGVISAHTKVTGDIRTRGHLAIYGEVEGDVSASGDIIITGKIQGDIVCDNLRMTGCQARTNIRVKGSVALDENARVEGHIQCRSITVDGSLRGDIDARDEVNIYKNARIAGSIKAKALGIESGAELQGNVAVVK